MKLYREAVTASGIEWATWNDLRHTFASGLAMRVVPLITIEALLRHSTTGIVKQYAPLSREYLKVAIEEVSSFGRVEHKDKAVPGVTDLESASNGTVTLTGNEGEVEEVEGV